MNLLWRSFLKHAALQSTAGSIRTLDGLEAAWVHSALVINNGTYLTSPASSEGELRGRFALASEDALPHTLPWALYLYEPYVASIAGEQVAFIAAEFGLARIMAVHVMTGDFHELKPPARPFPDLEFRRIARREESWIAFDLNLRSYGMPLFMADSSTAGSMWRWSRPIRTTGTKVMPRPSCAMHSASPRLNYRCRARRSTRA